MYSGQRFANNKPRSALAERMLLSPRGRVAQLESAKCRPKEVMLISLAVRSRIGFAQAEMVDDE